MSSYDIIYIKSIFTVTMHPEGIEPPAPEPESGILSVKLWVLSQYKITTL